MTDEAHYHLSGCVNKQNFLYWAEENPQQLHQWPLHSARVTVWCGVANFRVTGPYFFEDEDGHAVTVTSTCYIEMLWNFLTPELSCHGNELLTTWFQQDGTAAHTVRASMEVVREMFLDHITHISLRGELQWPAHSPDLSACDYFLWGTSNRKSTPLDYRPSMTSRSQFRSKFQ
jgi:hypothetical protein